MISFCSVMSLVAVVTFFLIVHGTLANVPRNCLDAICHVESNCMPLDCKHDVTSPACGYYQIHENYYTDCGRPGNGWEVCSKNKRCAEGCVQVYMNHYARTCTGGRTPTCEDYARIHNGGPWGCSKSSTDGYWQRVKRQLDSQG